jgi:small-conductance mechanosensitive channel
MKLWAISDSFIIVYLSLVALAGVTIIFFLRLWFKREEKRRLSGVDEIIRFVALKDELSQSAPTKSSKKRATESIATRFTMIRRLTIPFICIIILTLLGLPFMGQVPTVFVTVFATIATVGIGVSAKPFLENLVAGILISFSQQVRMGDLVNVDGKFGVIEEINLTYIVLKLWDWSRYVIPNYQMLQKKYENYTMTDKWQWSYVSFWVALDSDMDLVEKLAKEAVYASTANVKDCVPGFWIMEMDKVGVKCWVAGWVDHPLDSWAMRHEVCAYLIKSFKEHNLHGHLNLHHLPFTKPEAAMGT